MNTQNKRDRLINAAATLFHQYGLMGTSLADIAKDADIPIGNVYYYFKTKDELILAAILRHKEQYVALFTTLDETYDDPRIRLKKALEYYELKSDEFARFGCPIGKIIMDTEMGGNEVTRATAEVLECFVQWAEMQFQELGHTDDANAYANALLCGIQGSIVLAKALQQPDVMLQELARLAHFVDQLPNKRIHLGKVSMMAGSL